MNEEPRDPEDGSIGQSPVEDEKPEVFGVKKDGKGYKFNRRGFIAAAAATGMTAMVGFGMNQVELDDKQPVEDIAKHDETVMLEVGMIGSAIVQVARSISLPWKIANKGKSVCRQAIMRFFPKDRPDEVQETRLPDLEPGQSIEVPVNLLPLEQESDQVYQWQIQIGTGKARLNELSVKAMQAILAESPHPYTNGMNQTWTIPGPDPLAASNIIHFTQIEVEATWDFVYVESTSGVVYQSLNGTYTNLTSASVPGTAVVVRLTSDTSVSYWGFAVDAIYSSDLNNLCYLPIIMRAPSPTPRPTPTSYRTCTCNTVDVCTCNLVCVCEAVCSCNGHCTCNTVHYWHPN